VRFLPVYKKYRDDIEFMVIYVREAHPTDKWWLGETKFMRLLMEQSNPYPSYELKEPETIEERRANALACQAKLLEDMPLFVDNMDNKVDLTYVAWPTRIYFLDEEGKVQYDSGLGPYGMKPDDLDIVLSKYLGKS